MANQNPTLEQMNQVAQFGSAEWRRRVTDSEHDPLHLARRTFDLARGLVEELDDALAAIDRNEELTDVGKQKAKRAAARKRCDEWLSDLKDDLGSLQDQLRDLTTPKVEQKEPIEQLLDFLRQAEVRQLLVEYGGVTDTLKTREKWAEALEAGDHAVLDAIATAPPLWPGRLPPDELKYLQSERVEHLGLVDSEAIQTLRDAVKDSARAVGSFEQLVGEVAGGPNDPVPAEPAKESAAA